MALNLLAAVALLIAASRRRERQQACMKYECPATRFIACILEKAGLTIEEIDELIERAETPEQLRQTVEQIVQDKGKDIEQLVLECSKHITT
ncbi:MAG: hypothetical protein F7C81_05490 [Desulfurococcales archaeon]|nr:hypothetical protein [Desulfurococcales archaeon]